MVLKSLLLNMSEEMTDLLGAMLLMALLVGAVVVANRTTLLNSIKQSATNSRAESRKAAVRKSLSCPALMELENPQEAVLACAEMFTKFEERAPRASFAGKSMPKTPSLPALVEGSSEGESGLGRAAASSSNSDVDLTDLLGMSGSAAEHAPHVVVLGDAGGGCAEAGSDTATAFAQPPSQPRVLSLCAEVLSRSFSESARHSDFVACSAELLLAVLERDDLS